MGLLRQVVPFLILTSTALTSGAQPYPEESIKKGATLFAEHCTPCHGEKMSNPDLFNLRDFPKHLKSRFIHSVTNGKNAMPPWRAKFPHLDIENLWTYVFTGEKD